ncbi:MAG: hypothetical protein sL5_10660 [Candidatus Mesenet longicola]|uniref:Uncharacterized protein n=1 Tax=Candidatus Mesenet longicola TaxID=1892558 RepID=A0A8J3HR41_9RICK|nr:MAG: hypothetical protein sGL2_10990 [Candidatus Mesenet longicola]GHM60073.1 MAG: hypothetical protein sL5_10660 [Candidatus Mesenet longicola]
MPFTPKEILAIDIKVSPIELDDVTKKQPRIQFPNDLSVQDGSKRYLSIPEHSEKHNPLTPESGIGTDDGLPHFPSEEDKQSISVLQVVNIAQKLLMIFDFYKKYET